jgi:NAD(P)-dependent dehydrogenase (short-subunit alcohol dehydrogenase family)
MRLGESDVVLVTGGRQGSGRPRCSEWSCRGPRRSLLIFPAPVGLEFAGAMGERVRFAPGDVRDEDQVQAAVVAATELGTLRVVVNCAGWVLQAG